MEPSHEEDPTPTPDDPSANTDTSTAASPEEPEAGAYGKPDLAKRFLAQLIDGILALIVFWLLVALIPGWYTGYILGILAAGGFFLVRDGLNVEFMKQRSIGKKFMKLRPVRLDGNPMDLERSIKRNWMFGVSWLASLPAFGVLGTLIGMVAGLVILYECYKVLTDAESRRWGDELAGTRVIESDD